MADESTRKAAFKERMKMFAAADAGVPSFVPEYQRVRQQSIHQSKVAYEKDRLALKGKVKSAPVTAEQARVKEQMERQSTVSDLYLIHRRVGSLTVNLSDL